MAVIEDECKHGLAQSLCPRCDGNDRTDPAVSSGLAGKANPGSADQINVTEQRIFNPATAAREVYDSLAGSVNAAKTTTSATLTVLPSEHMEAGKGGEGGVFQITNAEFIEAVIAELPEGASAAVCSKPGNPNLRWMGSPSRRSGTGDCSEHNNYLGCSSFYPGDDGSFKARKAQFAACHFLMLDDLGTKVPLDRLGDFELSWLIETSPGNHQGGIILDAPITDGAVAVRLLNAVIDAGLCDAGATGPLSRWARLPVAINGKPKYADEAGVPFRCRLIEWRPDKRYSQQEIVDRLELELAPAGRPKKPAKPSASGHYWPAPHWQRRGRRFDPEGGGEPGRYGAESAGALQDTAGFRQARYDLPVGP